MDLSIAEQFLTPVDLQSFPDYSLIVAFPMDLSTIIARLQNRYYRLVASSGRKLPKVAESCRKLLLVI